MKMPYKADIRIDPFWAENSGFMTGRDPLGIQNSSISTYARLLPGLTNLTQRLRYYSIYCWLLSEYQKPEFEKFKGTYEDQYNFIRRAELIISFLMVNEYSEVKSVIGSDYATKQKDDLKNKGKYLIAGGADKFNKKTAKKATYWDFPSGALGQYYAGSLISLDLIETGNKYFHLKERGAKLAKAFEESIPQKCRAHFLNTIIKGEMDEKDMKAILPFSLTAIPEQKSEWNFFMNMFLENDGKGFTNRNGDITSKRKETIGLYLSYMQNCEYYISLDAWIYKQSQSPEKIESAEFGWYYYYLNEAFHYALETIFWSFLENLDGKVVSVDDYFMEFRDIILSQNTEHLSIDPNQKLEEVLTIVDLGKLDEILSELEELSDGRNARWEDCISKATELFLAIYLQVQKNQVNITEFEKLDFTDLQKGHLSQHINVYLSGNLNLSYSEYIEKLIRTIVNDHMATAYRKMGNGESNLLKFIIEDNIITHIQSMTPRHTTPRLHSLNNFLSDLKLLTNDETLTPEGKKYLKLLNGN